MRTNLRPHALSAVLIAALAVPCDASPAPQTDPGPSPRLDARRVQTPPTLDGSLAEAAWEEAVVVDGFTQMRPDPGEMASYATEVRVVYDDEAVYVGMRMRDPSPEEIAAQLARRDATEIYSDWAHVLIDSYHDRRTAFRFSVNPRGVQKDVLHFDDSSEDVNWDGVWQVATSVDNEGWVAEFRIPLSQLRFTVPDQIACASGPARLGGDPSDAESAGSAGSAGDLVGAEARATQTGPGCDELVWGVNFGREVARLNEWSWWAPVLPDVAGMVSVAGELHGIRELEPPRRLELLPYVVAQGSQSPVAVGDPFRDGREGTLSFGADLEYGLTSNLTLSATINPDFGQVEADPSVVNLTAQETFFQEKRPFFVEGSNIFSFGIGVDDGSGEGLFYTRRIGRSPQRGLDGDYTDVPGRTTILAAGKVSGRTSGGWSIGLLDAVTAEERGSVMEGGVITDHIVEPLTNYSVLRASRDFRDGRSALGFMATGTHRRLGATGIDFLPARAYAGGMDFRHRFARDTWSLSGWFAGSHVAGSAEAIDELQRSSLRYYQRPDADHLDYDPDATSLSGFGGTTNLFKIAGNWRYGAGGSFRSPGFEVNDAGFQTAADWAVVYANLRYHRFEPMGPFRNWRIGVNPSSSWDFGGVRAHSQVNFFGGAELANNWSFGWWSSRAFPATSTGALRGGPAIRRPGGWRANLWLETDDRLPVRVNAWGFWSLDDDGAGWARNGGLSATWRPSGRIDLSLGPSLNERSSHWQYVTQVEDEGGELHYVFAPIRQRTLSVTTRLSYAFTPTLSLQLYAQPFISAGAYTGFREVVDPQAPAFADRFHVFGADEIAYSADPDGGWGEYQVDRDGDGTADYVFGEPDFNFKELRSNLVLRWEYRPGSTLFVVWSQGRSSTDPTGSFRVADDFDRLLDADGSNVLAVKLNYWLDF